MLLRAVVALVAAGLATAAPAHARDRELGTTFPADFPVILDASLGTPLIGFGSDEARSRAHP